MLMDTHHRGYGPGCSQASVGQNAASCTSYSGANAVEHS